MCTHQSGLQCTVLAAAFVLHFAMLRCAVLLGAAAYTVSHRSSIHCNQQSNVIAHKFSQSGEKGIFHPAITAASLLLGDTIIV